MGLHDDEKDDANAELIVLAVNNHARLERENAELRAALESLVKRAHAAGWNSEDAHELDFQALRQARAALAKAHGNQPSEPNASLSARGHAED